MPEIIENPGPPVLYELLKKRLSKLDQEENPLLDREACLPLINENLDSLQKKLISNEHHNQFYISKK